MSDMYEHTDLVLETTICLVNIPGMNSTAERRGDKVVWTYERTPELEDFLTEFYAGKRLVEPLAFSKMLRSVRNSVYGLMGYNPPRLSSVTSDKSAA
jgi:hypothetical protein